jgi:hypothetical protein
MNDHFTLGFAPRERRDGDFPVSRDWKHIDCKATGCQYNIGEQCMVPSQCEIGEDGRCKGFVANVKTKTKSQIDGD